MSSHKLSEKGYKKELRKENKRLTHDVSILKDELETYKKALSVSGAMELTRKKSGARDEKCGMENCSV